MSRVYLVGFMGAGKTTIGKKLAALLGYDSFDLDDAFEAKYKTNIRTFFQKYDEPLFRKLEKELLASTYNMENVVISTGGGTPAFYNSIGEMNKHGVTVYLKMSVEALADRLKHAKKPRPLLKNLKTNSLPDFIREKLEEREPFYNQARLVVDAENIDIQKLYQSIRTLL